MSAHTGETMMVPHAQRAAAVQALVTLPAGGNAPRGSRRMWWDATRGS